MCALRFRPEAEGRHCHRGITAVDPVSDWANDFEIFDPEFVKDPYSVWGELRGRDALPALSAAGHVHAHDL